jgi:phage tail-like protein
MKIPGLRQYGDVTLRRGIVAGDNEIFEWFNTNEMGSAEARDVIVNLLDDDRQPAVTWKLRRAWITKITGPTLDARGNSVAIEEMTLSCEEIRIEHT